MTKDVTNSSQRSIALIGFRGSGKTSVGTVLAKLIGGTFVDSDELIAHKAGKSIADIFSDDGEAAFRRIERGVIADICADAPAVISVGGGAILDADNVADLAGVATIVWLSAGADVLHDRIAADPASSRHRPALTDRPPHEEVIRLLAERTPCYEQAADLTIDVSRGDPALLARAIAVQTGHIDA